MNIFFCNRNDPAKKSSCLVLSAIEPINLDVFHPGFALTPVRPVKVVVAQKMKAWDLRISASDTGGDFLPSLVRSPGSAGLRTTV